MGFRVNRRISLGKNVRVNIGKRGVSTSVKMGPVMLIFAIPLTLMSMGFTKLKTTLRKQLEGRRADDTVSATADAG